VHVHGVCHLANLANARLPRNTAARKVRPSFGASALLDFSNDSNLQPLLARIS
jgi:hypothetical protein